MYVCVYQVPPTPAQLPSFSVKCPQVIPLLVFAFELLCAMQQGYPSYAVNSSAGRGVPSADAAGVEDGEHEEATPDDGEGFDDAVDDVSYTVYQPRKLKLGAPHPDPVVENNSMAAVDPPELWYRLKLQVQWHSKRSVAEIRVCECSPFKCSLRRRWQGDFARAVRQGVGAAGDRACPHVAAQRGKCEVVGTLAEG